MCIQKQKFNVCLNILVVSASSFSIIEVARKTDLERIVISFILGKKAMQNNWQLSSILADLFFQHVPACFGTNTTNSLVYAALHLATTNCSSFGYG